MNTQISMSFETWEPHVVGHRQLSAEKKAEETKSNRQHIRIIDSNDMGIIWQHSQISDNEITDHRWL